MRLLAGTGWGFAAQISSAVNAPHMDITGDSQLRWIGPEKGAIHLATAAVVNAVWDLWAKAEGKPLWRLVVDMSPEELVRAIDFRYLTDCINPEEALALLRKSAVGKADRIAMLEAHG